MQHKSVTKNKRFTLVLLFTIFFCITSYKDLKKGFVEGYNDYNTTKSAHSKQQNSLIESDFYTIHLIMFDKIY